MRECEGKEFGTWIYTDEMLPIESGEYIVHINKDTRTATALMYAVKTNEWYDDYDVYDVEKWMPFPEV